jgi:anti-anti-sigma regulatory factor
MTVAAATGAGRTGPVPDIFRPAFTICERGAGCARHAHLRLRGAVHDEFVVDLREHLVAALAIGVRHVVVHADEQTELDLVVLQALHAMSGHLTGRGGSLILLGAQPHVCTVIAIHGLDALLAADPARAARAVVSPKAGLPSAPALAMATAVERGGRPTPRPRRRRLPVPVRAAGSTMLSPHTIKENDVPYAPLPSRRRPTGHRG